MSSEFDARTDINEIRLVLSKLESQINLLSPVEIITFKATVLESIRSIDSDIDKIEIKINMLMEKCQSSVSKKELEKVKEKANEALDIAKTVRYKVATYVSLAVGGITWVINYFMK